MKHLLFGFLFLCLNSLFAQFKLDESIINQAKLDILTNTELVESKVYLPSNVLLRAISGHKYGSFYIIRQRAYLDNVEIEDMDFTVAVSNRTGDPMLKTLYFDHINKLHSLTAEVNVEDAKRLADMQFTKEHGVANILNQKLVYKWMHERWSLAYRIAINGKDCLASSIYYIDANSGKILEIVKNIDANKEDNNRSKSEEKSSEASATAMSCTDTTTLLEPDPSGSPETYAGQNLDDFSIGMTTFLGAYTLSGTNVLTTSIAHYMDDSVPLTNFGSLALMCNVDFNFPTATSDYNTTFAYVHLNKVLAHFNGFTQLATSVKFNANAISPTPVAGYDGLSISISTGTGYSDMAKDLFHVSAAGANYFLELLNPNISTDINNGLTDYLAQSYKNNIAGTSGASCFDYGGLPILDKRFTDAQNCVDATRPFSQAEYLTSFLMQLNAEFGINRINELAILTADMLTSGVSTNMQFAEKLFDVANTMSSDFSCYDLYTMRKMIVEFFNPCFSTNNLAVLNINDYWIRVNNGDTQGAEPYWGGNGWESPDIFNTIDGAPAAPEYNQPNVMKVVIKNIGTGYCIPQKVKLYWSVNLTNQTWPSSWNTLPTSSFLGEADLPMIPAGQSYTAEIPWTAPNPLDFGSEEIHFCVLARIVDQSDEVARSLTNLDLPEYTGPWSTDWNVRFFNGTAWRNMVLKKFSGLVINQDEEITKDGLLLWLAGPSDLGDNPVAPDVNPNPSILDFDINVIPQDGGETNVNPPYLNESDRDPDFFNKVDVFIKPLGDLVQVLQNCAETCIPPETFSVTHDGYYHISSHRFAMNGLVLEGNKMYQILVRVKPKKEYDRCSFSIIQRNAKNFVFGGETYSFLNNVIKPRNLELLSSNDKISIFPNPAKSSLNLEIFGKDNIVSSISIVDKVGRVVKHITPINNSGNIEIDIANLMADFYIIEVEFDNKEKSSLKFYKE